MKKFLLSILLVSSFNCFAQAPDIESQIIYGGPMAQYPNSGALTSDGGYIMAGRFYHADTEHSDFWIVKFDTADNVVWDKKYGGSKTEEAFKVKQTSDGGYIIVGITSSNDGDVTGYHGSTHTDAWILKLNAAGEKEWQKALGGTTTEEARDVLQTDDGGYVVAGVAASADGDLTENNGLEDFWIFKLTSQGNLEWSNVYGGTDTDMPYAIEEADNGGYVIGGLTFSNDGDVSGNHGTIHPDAWLVKISEQGNLEWQKCYGSTSYDAIWSIAKTFEGNFILGAETGAMNGDVTTPIAGNSDVWIVKINQLGGIEWQNTFGGSETDYSNHVIQTDSGYLISCLTQSNNGDVTGNHGSYEGWLLKLGNDGNLQWQKCLGGSSFDFIVCAAPIENNKFLVVGYTESSDGDIIGTPLDVDAWIVKLGPETLLLNDFEKKNILIYPNPTSTSLNLKIPNDVQIDKIIVKDVTGKVIAERLSESAINIDYLQSGTYFIEIFAGKEKYQSKFIKE